MLVLFLVAGLTVFFARVCRRYRDDDVPPGSRRRNAGGRSAAIERGSGGSSCIAAAIPEFLGLVGILRFEGHRKKRLLSFFSSRKKSTCPIFSPRDPAQKILVPIHGDRVELVIRVVAAENKLDSRNGSGQLLLLVEIHMRHNDDDLAILLHQFGHQLLSDFDGVQDAVFPFSSAGPPRASRGEMRPTRPTRNPGHSFMR